MVKEEGGQYIVFDTTDGGYRGRGVSSLQSWKSVWDKNMNFVSVEMDRRDMTLVVTTNNKQHYDYYRVTRAKARHLRLLKDYLGIGERKKEKETVSVIYLGRDLFDQMNPLKKASAVIHDRTVEIGFSRHKKESLHLTESTPEKEQLAKEYNQKLQEFLLYREAKFAEIFGSSNQEEADTGE